MPDWDSFYKLVQDKDIDGLSGALKDREEKIRQKAAQALGDLKDGRAVDPLIGALKDRDDFTKFYAAKALGEIGDPRAAESLFQSLSNPSRQVWEATFDALEKLGWKSDQVERWLAALEHSDMYVRKSAADHLGMTIETLGIIRDARAIKPLIAHLTDEPYVSASAAEALGEFKDPQAAMPMITLLQDKNLRGDVVRACVKALAGFDDARAIHPIIAIFKDRDRTKDQRDTAFRALSDLLVNHKDFSIGESLIQLLNEGDSFVRNGVTWLLTKRIGDKRAIEPLKPLLNDPDWEVRKVAEAAMKELGEKPG